MDNQGRHEEAGLEYYVLDVFTERRLSGNALAVVLCSGEMSTETMRSIAREMNLSETTFVERRSEEVERREGVRVRIFTTEEELPFAGHPTLGTASLLRAIAPECLMDGASDMAGAHAGGEAIRLALDVGPILVRFEAQAEGSAAWPMRGEMTQRDPEFGQELDRDRVASLIGLEVEDFDPRAPIQAVSTGTAFAIVTLRSASALSRVRVRQEEAGVYLRACGVRWFYVLGPEEVDQSRGLPHEPESKEWATWRARMQFSGGEDPATGSAAGCAISQLVNRGVVKAGETIRVRQGVEIERPSEIYLSARKNGNSSGVESHVTDVRVGGSTILVARGRLFLS